MMGENWEKNKKETEAKSAEELKVYLAIEAEVMKRSNLEHSEWTDHYAGDFRALFNDNKERFLELYKKDPEELYALMKAALEIEDGD